MILLRHHPKLLLLLKIFSIAHVCSTEYWNEKERGRDNVCFITYEEMKSDLKSVITKVSTFLGKGDVLDDASRMEALMTHLSFDKMKDNKAVNKAEFVQVSILH